MLSVCMLAYNTERFIAQAIESVLAQRTDFRIELVISDNCSTDGTRRIIEEYRSKHPDLIRPLLNARNIGIPANFVQAYKACRGRYLATLDSDDFWTDPDKIERQVRIMEQDPEVGMVYSDVTVVDEEGHGIAWPAMVHYRSLFRSGDLFFSLLQELAFIPNLTTCFRRALITDDLASEDLWFFQDWWLWMRLSMKTRFHYEDRRTAAYRRHAHNVTSEWEEDPEKFAENLRLTCHILFSNLQYCAKHLPVPEDMEVRKLLFRRTLMVVNGRSVSVEIKLRCLPLLFRFFPGVSAVVGMLRQRAGR